MLTHTLIALASLAPAPITLPFNPATGHIVIRASLDETEPRWFILDTGNQNTTIFQDVADELGLATEPLGEMGGAGSGSITVRRASDLPVALGDASFTDPMVTVLPDAARLPPFDGHTIDGFLGASFIERFVIDLDYTTGTLTLHDPATYEVPENARVAEMKLWQGFPYFEGAATPTLQGEPTEPIVGNFLLDLGATYAVDIEHADAQRLGLIDSGDPAITTDMQAHGIDGVPFTMLSTPAHRVTMGGIDLNAARISFPDRPGGGPPIPNLVGNIGSAAFPNEIVTLDYTNNRLILTPTN